ncbi:Somatolactin [Triplophysa tibetana]|uniref:Somatolactin n=1 Tax=Triplophysa tibetana TaxID=1572043 RepID=A0A5A9NY97_9TELE|nr:Somatolactin [Triplophysa tibetana]
MCFGGRRVIYDRDKSPHLINIDRNQNSKHDHLYLYVPLDCNDGTSCISISPEKLLDRIIQHAELLYRVSEESSTLFEEMFFQFSPSALRNQGGNVCHSKPFPVPNTKIEIQQISSWIEPLLYLQTSLERYADAPGDLVNKTKWVYDKLLSLEQGLVVLIRKMLNEGVLKSSFVFEEALSPHSPEESALRDYNLLACFKKDAHKMETFLKLLKCRQSDTLSCFFH